VASYRSDLAFSQVREDPEIERGVIERVACRLGRPVRVLAIASGGCTVLHLASSPAVESIVAIDANPAQLHLVELKRATLRALSPVEGLAFLEGRAPQTFQRVRPHMRGESREYWDSRQLEVEAGVLRSGRFEQLFSELRSALARRAIAHEADDTGVFEPDEGWNTVFEQAFARPRLVEEFGPAAVEYSMDRSFGEHFADVFARGLRTFEFESNYFLMDVLEGRYDSSTGALPSYLHAAGWTHRAEAARRVSLQLATLADALDAGDTFDVVHCSNVSDWMPTPALDTMVDLARSRLPRGGAAIFRRLNGDHNLQERVRQHFAVASRECGALQRGDRSYFYREVVVGHRS
jgi:S-adenosylmethionine-diacylglycerol 3-amino-3-carboxypropyl transferase